MCECTAMVEHSGLSVQAPHQLFSARYNGWRSMLLLPLCRRQSTLKICAEQGGRRSILPIAGRVQKAGFNMSTVAR